MSVSDARVFDLAETYVQLEDGGAAAPVEVDAAFWQEVVSGRRRFAGRLALVFFIEDDTLHWEMHPAGEELIYLLSGAVDVGLDDGERVRWIELRPDAPCLLMPRGVWHRFIVLEPGELLFVTPGDGTRRRPV